MLASLSRDANICLNFGKAARARPKRKFRNIFLAHHAGHTSQQKELTAMLLE
jgi:hypothetical protein